MVCERCKGPAPIGATLCASCEQAFDTESHRPAEQDAIQKIADIISGDDARIAALEAERDALAKQLADARWDRDGLLAECAEWRKAVRDRDAAIARVHDVAVSEITRCCTDGECASIWSGIADLTAPKPEGGK